MNQKMCFDKLSSKPIGRRNTRQPSNWIESFVTHKSFFTHGWDFVVAIWRDQMKAELQEPLRLQS